MLPETFVEGDIAVKNGKNFFTGPAGKLPLEAESVVDIQGMTVVPGLIDSHMHIQSSMMIPRFFSQAVIPRGVTTVISEPHEIANAFWTEGHTGGRGRYIQRRFRYLYCDSQLCSVNQ